MKLGPKLHQNLPWMNGKILLRFVQVLGFPLALHIPTDRQTNKHLAVHPFININKTVTGAGRGVAKKKGGGLAAHERASIYIDRR